MYKTASKRQQYLTKTGEFSTRINRDAHEPDPHIESDLTIGERAEMIRRRVNALQGGLKSLKTRLKNTADEKKQARLENQRKQVAVELGQCNRDLAKIHEQTGRMYAPRGCGRKTY